MERVDSLPNRGSRAESSIALSAWNLSICNNPRQMPESHDIQPVAPIETWLIGRNTL